MKTFKDIRYFLVVAIAVVVLVFVLLMRHSTEDLSESNVRVNADVDASLTTHLNENRALSPTANIMPSDEKLHEDEVPAAMRAQLADIATAYAENARYPDYSKPLNTNDWNLLNPRALIARKASIANVSGMSASVVLDHYIIDRSIDQSVKVQLSTEPTFDGAMSVSRVSVWLQQKGQRSTAITLAGTGQLFSGVLPASLLRSVPQGETAVMAQLEFSNGARSTLNAMVKLYEPEARLVRLGEARVDGSDLVIPAYFEVSTTGQYLVAANLFNASNNEPVSHLNAELTLSPDNKSGLLKVHAVTLRAKVAAGPYVLKDFDITRLPQTAGDATGFGSTTTESFVVRGFSLDSYSHEPYQDAAAQQKLDFLNKLAAEK